MLVLQVCAVKISVLETTNFNIFIRSLRQISTMKRILLLLLFCLAFLRVSAQDQLGVPQIANYGNEQYNAGIQNWGIKQDKLGNLFIGNNEGLLFHNGRYWNLFKLPNNTSVRSIGIDSKNKIYVGGQDELGYFFPDTRGVLKYHSLLSLIPSQFRKFADVWEISVLHDEVFFRTKSVIFHYKDGTINAYKPKISWEFLGQANGRLYAHALNGGLLVYEKEVWKPICADPVLNVSAITSILPYDKDTLLVSTLKSGLFLFSNNKLIRKHTVLDSALNAERVYVTVAVDGHRYAVGTTAGGVYIINKQGRLLQKYNYSAGLQNNNVRGILLDQDKNMWLALDDGISFVAINSAVKNIFPGGNKQITSYAFNKFEGSLYIGTSNGLYSTPLQAGLADLSLSTTRFAELKNTGGQVWSLDEINNELLMGHEDGTFLIKNSLANKISATPGTWVFQPMSNVYPTTNVVAGTYWGLQTLNYSKGVFANAGSIQGISESLRFLVLDNSNSLWSSHPYHGVYKIDLSPDLKKTRKISLFTKKDGLPSTLYNYVYRIKNRVLVATLNGIYEYEAGINRFEPYKALKNALSGVAVQYLKEDEDGNIWFISNKKVGVIDFSKPAGSNPYSIIYLPEMDGKVVGGFECIYPLNRNNILIGANKGAYHVNYEQYKKNIKKPRVSIGVIKLIGGGDSIIFGGYFMKMGAFADKQDLGHISSFSNTHNSIHFEFTSTLFEHRKNISFSYQLEGFDKQWSVWTGKSEKDYTNLPAGKYTFRVKSRTNADNESEVVSYTFEILPAWYNSVWMNLVYLCLVGLLLRGIVSWQKRKHTAESARLSYLHQLELDRTEKQIVRLKNEKLEADVNYKDKELSTMTMHLVQRNKLLGKIKDVISTVIKSDDVPDGSTSFRHLVRLVRDVERGDHELDQLTMHFNNVNNDFFNKLKDRYPELSPNDLKFCAYLRMNLSSKEMAQLMNVTIKAIEVGRYRLRKKLALQPDVNLYEFLTAISRETIVQKP
jgi:ligand-binding sensor domain-containing protein